MITSIRSSPDKNNDCLQKHLVFCAFFKTLVILGFTRRNNFCLDTFYHQIIYRIAWMELWKIYIFCDSLLMNIIRPDLKCFTFSTISLFLEFKVFYWISHAGFTMISVHLRILKTSPCFKKNCFELPFKQFLQSALEIYGHCLFELRQHVNCYHRLSHLQQNCCHSACINSSSKKYIVLRDWNSVNFLSA